MIGTPMPRLSSFSTMCGTAAAASSLFTVTRTNSEPARAREATCSTVEATPAVSVLVMDCTTTGASEPTRTVPMVQVTDLRRWIEAMWKVKFNRTAVSHQPQENLGLQVDSKEDLITPKCCTYNSAFTGCTYNSALRAA